MDVKSRNYLLMNRQALQRDIKTAYIMDRMISDEVLTLQEEERVKQQSTQEERAAMLINIILTKDNNSYRSFYNALLHEGYRDLAALLQDGIPAVSSGNRKSSMDGMTSHVKTVLCEGGVPQRPVVFVTRPKLVEAIKKKLYCLGSDPGWVTVYGMAGCGKTVLTAEALRDHQLLEDCFPGGVHWISVGKQDKAGLLIKLQNLCSRLEHDSTLSQRPPLNIEEAKDRLRLLMLRKYPRSLLILDDIWDSWVLKAFDNQCQVLITSRDRSVTDAVAGNKYEVHVESGLAHEKGLEILSLFVNMKISELPEQANLLVRECKGSPLVISLIGALLRDFPSRWEYYLRQLQNKQFKRIRKSSSYDYEALDEAMSISVEQLNDNYKDYYKDLSVLPKDVKVPTKVLCILWDMETEEVEDILQEFVNKSLLFCDRNGKSFHYYLHDLQLDFLTEKNCNQLQELHKNIVNQYKKYYKLNTPVPSQEDCMYWYNFLAYHMAGANMQKELRDLMFSLDWIKAKTELVGPAHLIHEYVEYSSILDQKDSTVRENFQEFLSLNGHLLGREPFPDIIQLGLCQPETSEVYQQAKLHAQRETGTFYLEWINKKSLKNLYRLVVRPHRDAVYHACFSKDRQRIASCGADKTLQVFKAESGERLLEISAHDDEILCCSFSADGELVATCSADKKVKIWNSRTGQCRSVYEHVEQVNCCQFNNRSGQYLLATCSNDTFIKLWVLNENRCRNTMIGHQNSVNHCRFSPNDEYVASCSTDGTVKVWDTRSGNEQKSIEVKDFFKNADEQPDDVEVLVKCCSWSRNGDVILVAAKNKLLLWNIKSLSKVAYCRGHMSWVHCVTFSLDGSLFLTSSDDQTIRIWETKKVCKSSDAVLKSELDVVFHNDEVMILAIYNQKHLQLINGNTDSVIMQTSAQESPISCCCLSEDLKFAAFGQENGTIKVLQLVDGRVLKSQEAYRISVQHCQFTPDCQTLISSAHDSVMQVWNWQSNECVFLRGHKEAIKDFRLLENSKLLSWSFDGTVKVWNITTGNTEKDFACHGGAVLSCAVSPDGSKFSSTSADKTAKIWDIQTGALLHFCSPVTGDEGEPTHGGWVTDLSFSPDSNMLVSAGGYLKWWNVTTGESLQTFYTNGTNLKSIHVSPDFEVYVTVDNLGILYVLQHL
ncbi:apoptotic protease-activating factor 1 isoform X5 [Indicator indicator]|uniref:apoptotic protease-activating factor 1 isoform X5 n=1 Tax=Indicator indicator TaxID=1002788 RepID=UPI0023DFA416|nr:apoptotic protease-activating factor 1 isoform X5 [Indicator indicator]